MRVAASIEALLKFLHVRKQFEPQLGISVDNGAAELRVIVDPVMGVHNKVKIA